MLISIIVELLASAIYLSFTAWVPYFFACLRNHLQREGDRARTKLLETSSVITQQRQKLEQLSDGILFLKEER